MKFQIDHKSHLPLHIQVESLLRNLAGEEDYQNGKLFPAETDLANMLGIARNTVRQAFNKLVLEGVLIRKKGMGTRVVEKNVITNLDNWSYTNEMMQKGIETKNYLTKITEVTADADKAEVLGVPRGTKIIKMEKLKGTKKKPIVYFVSYFHPRIGLTVNSDFNTPLYKLLEEKHSIFASKSKEEIRAINADKTLAEFLKIEIGDPILYRKRRVFDPGERIIEYNLGFYRADSFTYTIDIERGK